MYSIREKTCHLDHKEKEILLLIHSMLSCDSVSGLFGFRLLARLGVALINQSFGDALANSSKREGPTKAAIHSDLAKSSIKKNCEIFGKLLTWLKDTVDFTESEDKTKLTYFAFSQLDLFQTVNDDVNPEECLAVGAVVQSELD